MATYDLNNIRQTNFQINVNAKYIGKKVNGLKDGFGVQEWPDGAKYLGLFLNNKANGYGMFFHRDSDSYKGEFLEDKLHGYGIYTHSNGASYEGEWFEETQNGIGIEAIYHNNKKINFKNYKVFIQYTTPKDVVYRFLVSQIDINYNENIIRFYTKQTAKPFGYRQMHRYTCGYDADIKVEGTKLNLNGYCKDASYAGIAFICKD